MIRGYGFLSVLPARYGKCYFNDIIDEHLRTKMILYLLKDQTEKINREFKFYHYGEVGII